MALGLLTYDLSSLRDRREGKGGRRSEVSLSRGAVSSTEMAYDQWLSDLDLGASLQP